MQRRTILALAGSATVSMAAMAGCLGSDDDEQGDDEQDDDDAETTDEQEDDPMDDRIEERPAAGTLPDYTRWIPGDGEESIVYADLTVPREYEEQFSTLFGEDSLVSEAEDEGGDGEPTDPMIEPVGGFAAILLIAGFTVDQTGLSGLLDDGMNGETDAGPAFETTIDEVLITNGALVMSGDIDTAEVDNALTAAVTDEDDEMLQTIEYEADGSIGEYDRYRPLEGSLNSIAVGDDAIVMETEADVSALEPVIGAKTGDRDRATETNDDFEWLLSSIEHGHIAVGGYDESFEDDTDTGDDLDEGTEDNDTPEDALSELEGPGGFASSMTMTDDGGATGAMALVAATIDDAEADELEASIGMSATTADVDMGIDWLTATATWEEAALTEL